MRVLVDQEKCCGSGQCVMDAPDVFDQDDDGLVVLLNDQPAESLRPAIQMAVNDCPTAAIELTHPHARD